MTRGGRTKDQDAPERRCIATGETQPKDGLIRFAISPDGMVVPDVMEKLPGRGIWVAASRAALTLAISKKLFSRAAKQQVTIPEGLVDDIEAALLKRVQEHLSMARKANLAVAGFEKVKSWLEGGEAAVLIQAADGSGRGKAKLRPPEGENTHVSCLTGPEIGLAFGREHVIHAALRAGGLATRVVEEAARLSGVREDDGGKPAGKGSKDL